MLQAAAISATGIAHATGTCPYPFVCKSAKSFFDMKKSQKKHKPLMTMEVGENEQFGLSDASRISEENDDAALNQGGDSGDDPFSVSETERDLLEKAAEYSSEEQESENELRKAIPDITDGDGEPLNETISYNDLSARDLDIPDEFEDDPDEELGK